MEDNSADKNLLAASAGGNRDAFARLYERHATAILSYAIGLSGQRELAEEIVQQVFVRLLRSLQNLGEIENLRFYLLKSARNLFLNELRSRRRLGEFKEQYQVFALKRSGVAPDPQEKAQNNEMLANLNEALGKLSAAEREVVLLKIRGDLTFREIAEMAGEPQNTVLSRYYKALERLKKRITDGA
jgi:RNA polymerase sigma-70 factor (ECF subfamily)